jgi:uncharacterized membrane protein
MWFFLSLTCAVFVAFERLIMKMTAADETDRTIVFSRFMFGLIPALLLFFLTGAPEVKFPFFSAVFFASLTDVAALILLSKSLRSSQMGKSIPLLSFTPVFLLLTSFIIVGEKPNLLGVLGILIIVFGSYCLRAERNQKSLMQPFKLILDDKGSRYILFTAFLFSFTGPFLKKSVLNSSPYFTIVVAFNLSLLILFLFHVLTGGKTREIIPKRKSIKKVLLLGGCLFMISLTFNLAVKTGLVPYVVSIKRMSILFNVLLGFFIFKEKNIIKNLRAAFIMVLGAFLIALS